MMEQFAVAHLSLPKAKIAAVFSRMAEAVTETRAKIPDYITHHPEFHEVGDKMMTIWNEGVNDLCYKSKMEIEQ